MILTDKMPKNPKISVIMSVYNSEKYLREAIESVLNQTFTDFEFIIVNDGSTDNSPKIIKSHNDERIRIINNEKNIGLTKSLNKALKQGKGEYIARQDADDVSLPNRFEMQVKYLESHPEVVLLGTSFYLIDETGEITKKYVVLAKPTIKDLIKENQFSHGSVMVKKEIVDKLGGYNELFRYSQDYELWLRIAECYEVRNLRQILYKLRSHNENIRFMNWKESLLYYFFTLRLARNHLDEGVLKVIKDGDIRALDLYLSKSEKIRFHKVIAGTHVQNNNMKLAREEYKKVFALDPFDIINDINIVRSYFGKDVITKSSKIYGNFMKFLRYLRNQWSK